MAKPPPLPVVKKRSRALPLSPWLGHEKRANGRSRCKGKSKGRKRMMVRSKTARGEIIEPRVTHTGEGKGQIEKANAI
jgi:hypothetical protein